MYRHSNKRPNYRSTIEAYASEGIIYDLIEQHFRTIKLNKKKHPQHIKQLEENHFLHKLLRNENTKCKTFNLRPFISPSDLMKAYNKKYSKYRFFATEVYYYYEPTLNNQNREDVSDPKDFFFEVKNKLKQDKMENLSNKILSLMNIYLNKSNQNFIDTNQYQSLYVIPEGYFPLITMKIKYEFKVDFEIKNGFQYLILRYDEHESFKFNSTLKVITQSRRKQKLKINIQRKKNERALKIQPEEISRKQQLKAVYKIRNVSFGWIETEEMKSEKSSRYQTYFDVKSLEDNIRNAQKNQTFRTKTYLFFKKGEFQIPRIQILSFLYEQIVFKCVIKLSDIKKVQFFSKHQLRQIYLHVNSYPQYYLHILDKNTGYTLFNLGPWQRIQNFPIEYQEYLAQSPFMRNMLSSNSVICINFDTGREQFNKVVRYFQAQQIIQSELMIEKPFYETGYIQDNKTFKLQKIFKSILSDIKNEQRIIIHHIKFSLMSLKSMQKTKITFDNMINLLQQIEKQKLTNLLKHNDALKMLCLKPHQLLSKPFSEIYSKYYKKQQLIEKLGQKFSKLQLYQIIKLEEALQLDSISQVSDISSISEISQVQLQLIGEIANEIIEKQRLVFIPKIKLTPNGIVYDGWSMEVASKILKHYRDFEYQFLKCQICDDKWRKIQNSPHVLQTYIRKAMNNIKVLNEEYVSLGWSQSQLKEGSLWYTLKSQYIKTESRDSILHFLGDFNDKKLENPALKAARIGQNFGSSWSFDASQIDFIEEEDILADNNCKKNFSDGIGCISEINMTRFRQELNLSSLAAVQIRFKGIKGVLSLNKELKQNTAIVRKSMIKYQTTNPQSVKYFDIIDYSKYKVGYLNRQIIILLIANMVNESEIMSLQNEYIRLLEKNIFEIMFENIAFENEDENLLEKQNDKKFESISEVFKMILSKTYDDKKVEINKIIYDQNFFKALKIEARRKLLSKLKQKCRIRVEKSVRLFGILDQFRVLGEYEVYCSIQKNTQNNKKNITGKCLLTKNPCMHPADLRVVTCISDEQIQKRLRQKGKDPYLFEQLVNVIIFPQQGKTPLTMEISQSDLDGDEFFLCWDQRIVPFKNLNPFVIDEQVLFIERNWKGSGYEEMLDFFVQFQNFNKLGRLANSHLIHADLNKASCRECIELCKIHSIAVQYPKRGYDFKISDDLLSHIYPHFMQKQHPLRSYRSREILGKLYDAILKQSNIKGYNNQKMALQNNKQNFWRLIQVDINMNQLKEIRRQFVVKYSRNKIIDKYQINQEEDNLDEDVQQQINQQQQGQQPVSYSEVKKQYQIENKQFYKRKKVPFSKDSLLTLMQFIQTNQQAKKHDINQPFSLLQILNTFNYLCIFYYELKYLSELLENQYQSIYTIYFQLHTSSKNNNNLFILERINDFREKWLNFFAQELVSEGCFKSVVDFKKIYFKQLIQKKPEYQDTTKMLSKLKEQAEKKRFIKKATNQFKQNGQNINQQFITEEMQNLNIVKKSIQYDTYTYQSSKDLNPLVYRKLVLFYIVSNYFSEIIQAYDIKKLAQFSTLSYGSNKLSFNARSFLENGELSKALQFYKENQVDFLGFCWFCLPKLMVVWWRDIVNEEQVRIQQKIKQQKASIAKSMNKKKIPIISKQEESIESHYTSLISSSLGYMKNDEQVQQQPIKHQSNLSQNKLSERKNCEIF